MFIRQFKKGRNDLWIYIITFIGVILAYAIGQIPLTVVLVEKIAEQNDGVLNPNELAALSEKLDFTAYGISLNTGLVLLLLSFFCAFMALWALVKWLHRRPFKTLITPASSINWSKIFFAFGLWMLMAIVMESIAYFYEPANYTFQYDPAQFWILLLIACTLLVFQTSFEEIFMRGYLLQGIASASRYRIIPLIVTSVFFGSLHFLNPEVSQYGMGVMMTYYIGTGLFLGVITLLDDSLELALGVHAATNIYGALFVTFSSSALQTPALFSLQKVNITLMMIMFIAGAVIFFIICKRKYGWNDWRKVYGKVELDSGIDSSEETLVVE